MNKLAAFNELYIRINKNKLNKNELKALFN